MDKTDEIRDHLMALYNKAIEYYGAKSNMEKSQMYLTRLKQLFEVPVLSSTPQQPSEAETPQPSSSDQGPQWASTTQ